MYRPTSRDAIAKMLSGAAAREPGVLHKEQPWVQWVREWKAHRRRRQVKTVERSVFRFPWSFFKRRLARG